MIDAPGCDLITPDSWWESECVSEACARHDRCYHLHGCNWLSFVENLGPSRPQTRACQECNDDVVSAIIACVVRDESITPFRGVCNRHGTGTHLCYTRMCGGQYYCSKGTCADAPRLGDSPIDPITMHEQWCPPFTDWIWTSCDCRGRPPRYEEWKPPLLPVTDPDWFLEASRSWPDPPRVVPQPTDPNYFLWVATQQAGM